jgi:extracellular factor (EF) 3-hydroxypalmitic acid methyl ester biosynthesis protein
MNSMACCAVRWRRDLLAARLASMGASGKVLSLAAGHLREARLVRQMGRDLPQIDALDQDPLSLAEIKRSLVGEPVSTHHAGVCALLKRTWAPERGSYDLVYAAGLYDYLSDEIAAALSARLVERVRVGGAVLVANFLPLVSGVGHMECFMDWFLTFRTHEQLENTFAALGDQVTLRSFTDPFHNVVYTEATRLR